MPCSVKLIATPSCPITFFLFSFLFSYSVSTLLSSHAYFLLTSSSSFTWLKLQHIVAALHFILHAILVLYQHAILVLYQYLLPPHPTVHNTDFHPHTHTHTHTHTHCTFTVGNGTYRLLIGIGSATIDIEGDRLHPVTQRFDSTPSTTDSDNSSRSLASTSPTSFDTTGTWNILW